ncbi:MAG TPA: type II toxin-antitoxin system Phd/YefM family antitoxin [Gammaproteobacteria bacterium]|jgi:prevent-host-death family protein|nr:type II toxin-antitoxin system Phd/YefM family antitoxin [Gammaproteobacteria bacterium]
MQWRLAEAKNRFSEVVNLALIKEPQHITRRNDAVVLISKKEYDRLTGKQMGIKEFLMNAPSLDDLDLERDKSPMRNIEL